MVRIANGYIIHNIHYIIIYDSLVYYVGSKWSRIIHYYKSLLLLRKNGNQDSSTKKRDQKSSLRNEKLYTLSNNYF